MKKSALIVVDMQNDFMEGGKLEVPNSIDIILPVNKLISTFDKVVATKDWHPLNHYSFARNCGVKPFETVENEVKWPDHCIAGTWGSEFHKNLNTQNIRAVFHKGMKRDVESYSGFKDAKNEDSGLVAYLQEVGSERVQTVFVCGLALDYCVKATALHASEYFETYIVSDATLPVDSSFTFDFQKHNIKLVTTSQALKMIKN